MKRRLFLGLVLGAGVFPRAARPSQPRPLVLIFPTTLGRIASVTSAEEKPGVDGLTDGDRINLATQAVRNQLEEEKVVVTLVYSGTDPYYQRVAEAAKLKLPPGTEPDEAARLKLGAEIGAQYVLTVFSRLAIDQPTTPQAQKQPTLTEREKKLLEAQGQKPIEYITVPTGALLQVPTLELEAIEVRPGGKAGKRWQDKTSMVASSEGGRRPQGALPAGLQSAARTLVLRLLGGPLREYTRTALDPSLLPPPVAPVAPATTLPATDFDAEADRLRKSATELMTHDKAEAAIAQLREAVSYQPRLAATRILLAQAYQRAGRPGEASAELRRALKLRLEATPQERAEMSRLLARALVEEGDQDGATQLYNQLLADNDSNVEARIGLAELLIARGQNEAAEIQFRLIRQKTPDSMEAGQGLVRLLLGRGALEEALKEAKQSPAPVRHAMAIHVFIQSSTALAALLAQNRSAWEESKLSREVFYKATLAQSARAKLLVELLGSAPPTENASEVVRLAHSRRVLAANLLAQSVGSLQEFLETGEQAAGVRARTLLAEFYTEMKDAQHPAR